MQNDLLSTVAQILHSYTINDKKKEPIPAELEYLLNHSSWMKKGIGWILKAILKVWKNLIRFLDRRNNFRKT